VVKQLAAVVHSFTLDDRHAHHFYAGTRTAALTDFALARPSIFQEYTSLLSLAWRGRSQMLLACVGPAYTVQVWVYGEGETGTIMGAADGLSACSQPLTCVLQTTYYEHSGEVTALAWSPVTLFIASASEDGVLRVWDAWTGNTYLVEQQTGSVVRTLSWSPDGCWLTIGYDDNSIRVLDISTRQVVASYAGHGCGRYGIDALAWSPDGQRLAAAGDDASVQIWDMRTGRKLLKYEGHREQWALVVAWSPDGHWVASGGDDIHVWNATTGECRQVYSAHEYTQNWIDALAWSPDGRSIATSSTDRVLNIWYVATARTIYSRTHPGSGEPCHGLRANALAWFPSFAGCKTPDLANSVHQGQEHRTSGRASVQRASYCLAFASCDKTVSLIRLPIEE
jgi:FOG: WD40 repeat